MIAMSPQLCFVAVSPGAYYDWVVVSGDTTVL